MPPVLIGAGVVGVVGTVVAMTMVVGRPVAEAAVSAVSSDEASTISGSIQVINGDLDGATRCYPAAGQDDIHVGTEVTVRDGRGQILGASALAEGEMATFEGGVLQGAVCDYPFTLADIPRSDFYEIEVGERGSLNYSYEEMVESGWVVGFTLY